jgi:hypothetical protein
MDCIILIICLLFFRLYSRELYGLLIDEKECQSRHSELNLKNEYHHADKIIDNIYLGDVCAAHNRTWLIENNISLVVNVALEWDTTTYYGIDFLYIPFDDTTDQDIKATRRLINEVASRLINEAYNRNNTNILIHCNMGISRSSTILLRYLQIAHHMNYHSAIEFIKEKRPFVKPNSLFKRILINMDL